jgi:hypothetical protein
VVTPYISLCIGSEQVVLDQKSALWLSGLEGYLRTKPTRVLRRIVAFLEYIHAAQNTPGWHSLDIFKSWTRFAMSGPSYMTFDVVLLLTSGMRKRCRSRSLVYKKEPSST